MLRTLAHYWRTQLAVAIAVAVCGAVLTGALLVGDSVRGSLRDLTLDRLGGVDVALLSERFFRADLATDLTAQQAVAADFDSVVGAVLLRGNAVHGGTRARASQINVVGLSEALDALIRDSDASAVFTANIGEQAARVADDQRGPFAPVTLNEALAGSLGAELGDQILIRFQIGAEIPRDTLLGERATDEVVGTVRAVVNAIVPNHGLGRFELSPHQSTPLNAFLDLERLQDALDQPDRINAVLLGGALDISDAAQAALGDAVQLADLGLDVEPDDGGTFVVVSSDEYVLRPPLVSAIETAAVDLGSTTLPLQSYLANALRANGRTVPYSMVLAVDPPETADGSLGALTLRDGTRASALNRDAILLNTWTAAELGVTVGDSIELDYYVVGIDERLRTETAMFEVAGIAAMEGLAGDPDVTPEYPGIEGVDNIADWDPPFPLDLSAIRPVDEEYWDDHRGTPKAFVSAATGAELWATRYGATTAMRVAIPETVEPGQFAERLGSAITEVTTPAQLGYRFLDAKRRGLDSATGATDFAGLFIAFSFFIIFSALLIVAMLFNLGIDARARELGALRALGFPARKVRSWLVAEGLVVASVGASLGVVAGVGYAKLMLWGLTTLWLPAVGSPLLFLHVQTATLAIGFAITVVVSAVTIGLALRRLRALAPTRLLAGDSRRVRSPKEPRRSRWLAPLGMGSGLGLIGYAVATGQSANPGIAFGAGFALLVAGLASFAYWNGRPRQRVRGAQDATLRMALRSAGWNPGRSLLSATLVASACFVIVTVASNTRDPSNDEHVLESGAGGYRLLAQADVPLHHDLNSADGRFDLGFGDDASDRLADVPMVGMRTVPGDDTSCLNLYQPQRPRLLGIPAAMIDRGGFHFGGTVGEAPENPWELLNLDLGPNVVPVIGDANSMQWILKLALGNELVIASERGEPIRLHLVGTLRESVFQSELLMSEAQLLRHFPSRSGFAFFLIDASASEATTVTNDLEATLERFGFDVESSTQRIADFLVVQNTYLSTFQALGGLGLLLGTIGLGIVLLRNVIERRGELATLRAVGFPRRALSGMVLAENAVLLTAGLAIGAGAALLAVAPRWLGGDLQVPWTALGAALGAVLTVGMAASLGAVRVAARIPLLPALRGED